MTSWKDMTGSELDAMLLSASCFSGGDEGEDIVTSWKDMTGPELDAMLLSASCFSGGDEGEDVVTSWKDLEKIARQDRQRQREREECKASPPAVATLPLHPSRQASREALPEGSVQKTDNRQVDAHDVQVGDTPDVQVVGMHDVRVVDTHDVQVGIVEAGNLLMAQLTENNRASSSSLFGGRTVDLDIVMSRTTRTAGTSTDSGGDGGCSSKENKLATTNQRSHTSTSTGDKGGAVNEVDSNKERERIAKNRQMREEKRRRDREEQRRREKDLALMYMSAKAPHLSMQILDSIDLGE